jgi:mitochondrial Rho GTPase 1
VILAGTKCDLVPATLDEQSSIRSRQQLISLLERFRFVRGCVRCSSKNLLNLDDVFGEAQKAVLYPYRPLIDVATNTLTKKCQKALTRIFRMFDADCDGYLNSAELEAFQLFVFQFPLVNREVNEWKRIVSRNNPAQRVIHDGKFTVAGFLAIFVIFIDKRRLEVPWKVLRKFGYTNDLELTLPQEHPKSIELSKADRRFLASLFHQFDKEGKGTLLGEELSEIFSIVSGCPLPPWHPLRANKLLKGCFSRPIFGRDGAGCPKISDSSDDLSVSESGITISSGLSIPTLEDDLETPTTLSPMNFFQWMGHWHMLNVISPYIAQAELFRLGHVSNPEYVSWNRRKKIPITMPSEELVVFIFGSRGCGKSSLMNLLSDWPLNPRDTKPTTSPETSIAHMTVRRRKKDMKDETEEVVVYLTITEVPLKLERIQALKRFKQKRPCLVLFCFDSKTSLAHAIDIERELLDDNVARHFLYITKTDPSSSEESADAIGVAQAHCEDLDLEPPTVVNTFDATTFVRTRILKHLVQCGLDETRILETLRSKPYAEQKKQEYIKRRKIFWLAGLVTVGVSVAVMWRTSRTKESSPRWNILRWLFRFNRDDDTVNSATVMIREE